MADTNAPGMTTRIAERLGKEAPGCDYGKNTRWALGVLLVVLLAAVATAMQKAETAASFTADVERKVIERGEDVGRLDERMCAMKAQLLRIESRQEDTLRLLRSVKFAIPAGE